MSLAHSLALEIVPVELALPHERHNSERVDDLIIRLLTEGRLVNPPVATPSNGRYVILDGATRLTAFRRLGYPHIILQVVDLYAQQVQMHMWHHLVRGGNPASLLAALRRVSGVTWTPAPVATLQAEPLPYGALAAVIAADGAGYVAQATESNADLLELLHCVVDAYSAWGKVERTLTTDAELLHRQYADWAGLVLLPRYSVEAVLDLAARGRTVPAGITRFLIPGRILRLNAPLARLAAADSLEEKRAWLERLLAEKLAHRQARYYEEPVFLLDE